MKTGSKGFKLCLMHPIGKGKVTNRKKSLKTQLIALYKDENAKTVNKENKDKVKNEIKNIPNKKIQVMIGRGAINEFLLYLRKKELYRENYH